MRPALSYLLALMLAAPALSSCARRGDVSQSSLSQSSLLQSNLGTDDDAFCRANNVVVGSSEYAACRKDRDVQRGNAAARADRAQRNLGEYMLNNPVRP